MNLQDIQPADESAQYSAVNENRWKSCERALRASET